MGGLQRLKPQIIPASRQERYTCTTLGCPDPAVVVLPLNVNATIAAEDASGLWNATDPGTVRGRRLEMRLCRKCVRTMATALPPGMRLPGAQLRYPEVDPEVCSAEEIPGTPEYIKTH